MFFTSRKSKARAYTRYGRSPLLTNKPGAVRNRKRMAIPNVSMPTLKTVKLILVGLCGIVLLGASTYALGFSSYVKIQKIDIQYDEFQQENEQILTYFDGLKGKNLLFVDTTPIAEQIKKDHPELQQVTVKKSFPSKILVHFSEYPIVANIERIVNGKNIGKVLINSVGMPVYGNAENPNLPFIKIVSRTTAKPEPAVTTSIPDTATFSGEMLPSSSGPKIAADAPTPAPIDMTIPILSAENLNYILKATAYFEEKFGMQIQETQFLIQARELHVLTEKNFAIWLDTQISYERQFLKLKKAMATLDIYKEAIAYIDLRISGTSGEKVIFKRRK